MHSKELCFFTAQVVLVHIKHLSRSLIFLSYPSTELESQFQSDDEWPRTSPPSLPCRMSQEKGEATYPGGGGEAFVTEVKRHCNEKRKAGTLDPAVTILCLADLVLCRFS